jgi:D-arabinose 1-dehydrogenase-like Zn-dependent alcohol dehydrogenase
VPGHQIAGVVDALGNGVTALAIGDRVGVRWLGFEDPVSHFGPIPHRFARTA